VWFYGGEPHKRKGLRRNNKQKTLRAKTFPWIYSKMDICSYSLIEKSHRTMFVPRVHLTVLDPEKGVCADPVGGDATLGVGGPGSPVGVSERQLSLDKEGEKM
jgi:hypothetical protein